MKGSAISCLLLMSVCFLKSQSVVTMSERPLTIPTYTVAPPDKNPMFYTGRTYQGARGEIYPHPLYDVLTDQKSDYTYKAVFIENEYTELCVMPELGGRILSALDKTDQFDFVYREHVIKPALIGMIGAWISGGVEWNIPDHHRATSHLPVDYMLENHDDGSRTVWVGETELSRSLKWRVGLTIYPGRSYIEATVKVFNSTPFIQPFLYWANLSVHTDENYQVIFPPSTQFGVQHAKHEFTTWPIGSNYYGGVDRKGTELSWWKNHPNPASIFAWNFQDDFLAGYDHKKEAGTVHIANHQVVGGKKFFLWGNNPEAKMWEKMLTESDGQYLELMTGAYSDNQPDYSWIAPGETREFKQYWYPIKKIGGVKNATTDAALNLERLSADSLFIGIQVTGVFKNARFIVQDGKMNLTDIPLDIDPLKPLLKKIRINPQTPDTAISVKLISNKGRVLVAYQPRLLIPKPMPKPIDRPGKPESYTSNEELYLTGLRLEQFRNATNDPMPYYQEALRRDSLDARVNTTLGIDAAKDGKIPEASAYLKKAISRITKNYTKPKDGEAFYYLGVVQQLEKNPDATDNFWKATIYCGFQAPAYYRLAQIACTDRRMETALEMTDQSLFSNARYTDALNLKAHLLRKNGHIKEAQDLIKNTLLLDPLDHWTASEKYFANQAQAHTDHWNEEDRKDFRFRCGGNVQTVLDLSLHFADIGEYPEALQILKEYDGLGENQLEFPFLYYYQGFFQYQLGDTLTAGNSFKKGELASPDYCFPFRLNELTILQTAIRQNKHDARAHYYLGNLFYFLNQRQKAQDEWQQAVLLQPGFYQALRNLGFAYSQENKMKNAISSYEKAIALNREDARFYYELDLLKEKDGVPAADRMRLLEDNRNTVEKRDDAMTRLLELYNITGNYDKAIPVLTTRHFHVWEGGGNIHDTYVDAFMLRGIDRLKKNQYAEAVHDFKEALKYPDNLEVGEPYYTGRNAEIHYFIARALTGSGDTAGARQYYRKILSETKEDYRSRTGFYRAEAPKYERQEKQAGILMDKLTETAKSRLSATEGQDFFSKFGTETPLSVRQSQNYFLLGLSYLGKGDQELARQQFTKALELDRNNIWAGVFLSMKS